MLNCLFKEGGVTKGGLTKEEGAWAEALGVTCAHRHMLGKHLLHTRFCAVLALEVRPWFGEESATVC